MNADPLTRQLEETKYRLTREIRENPLLCVGIALGVGAVIGVLGSRAASCRPGASRWLADLADDLTEEASEVRSSATRAGRHATQELKAALEKAAEAAPEVDIDRLVRRGRRWLHSLLR